MEIFLRSASSHDVLNDKIDMDEEIVRHALLRAWLKLLDKYATPGACIPSAQEVHKEMLKKGVDAAVKALGDEHWFAFRWVIEDEIRAKVERGLSFFDLEQFIKDVRMAQRDPMMLQVLREEIRCHVLFDDVN